MLRSRFILAAAVAALAFAAAPAFAVQGNPVTGIGVSVEQSPGPIVTPKGAVTDRAGAYSFTTRTAGTFRAVLAPQALVRGGPARLSFGVTPDGAERPMVKLVTLPSDITRSDPFTLPAGGKVTIVVLDAG